MFHIEDVLHLHERERLLGVARQHAIVLARGLLLALICIVVPFFFIFQLISWGAPGMILFLIAILFGAIIAIRAVMLWNAHVLIATTERLVFVHQRGVFSRFVTDVSLSEVQDIQWKRAGLIDSFLKLGTLIAKQSGTERFVRFTRLPRPQEFVSLVQEAKQPYVQTMVKVEGNIDSIVAAIDSLLHEDKHQLFELLGVNEIEVIETVFPVVQHEISESGEKIL